EYLEDHRLFGTLVVAGASHIAMLLNAAKASFGSDSCIIEDLLLQEPVILADDEIRTLHLALTPQGEKVRNEKWEVRNYSFQLLSSRSGKETNDNWQTHITGKMVVQTFLSEQMRMSAADRQKCLTYHEIPPQEFLSTALSEKGQILYDEIRKMGHHLGDSFRRIEKILSKETEAFCQITSPDLPNLSDYQLHPGIIDSCFQFFCIRGPALTHPNSSQEGNIYIPFSAEEIRFYAPPDKNRILWCHIRFKTQDDPNSLKGDISLSDETGQLIAEINGFIARRLNRESLLRENLLYETIWQVKERSNPLINQNKSVNQLVLANKGGFGKRLSDELKAQGVDCTVVLSEQEDLKNTFESVLGLLAEILMHDNISQLPRLWLITQGSTPAASEIDPFQATLWGLARVISLEHPDIPCICVDFDPEYSVTDAAQLLVEEIQNWDGEDQIAWRDGIRYVQRLTAMQNAKCKMQNESTLHSQRRAINRPARSQTPLKRADMPASASIPEIDFGAYLITGGTGALGLQVAKWLSEKGASQIVLTSRRPPSPEAKEAIAEVEKSGTRVVFIQADVSDKEEAARLIQDIRTSMPPLKGIIHLAGIIEDAALLTLRKNMDKFHRVLAPKVYGAWNLHTLTQDLPLDFFVCFSSAASILGSAGQGNYAAANAFMDALAHHRRAKGLPGLSINWGAFAKVGMAANLGEREQARLQQQGVGSIAPETGLSILEKLLGQDAAQAAVLPIEWSKYLSYHYGTDTPPFFSTLQPKAEAKTSAIPSQIIRQMENASDEERRSLLENYLREQAAIILRAASVQEIELGKGLFEMGFDSLMAVELKNRLESDLGHPLRSTLVFNYPNIAAITDYLMTDVLKFESSAAIEDTPQEADSPTDSESIPEGDIGNMLEKKLAEIEKFLG
ncbi:MAG TPA: hypothetical protein DCQ37_23135, partial [Desulfobacteraceae bacterium]|nr:hypothetical protein [Desulfobacteraceae bacterium]